MRHSDHVHGRSTSSLVACLACDDEDYARPCPAAARAAEREAAAARELAAYVPRIKRPADPFAVFDAIHARECEPF